MLTTTTAATCRVQTAGEKGELKSPTDSLRLASTSFITTDDHGNSQQVPGFAANHDRESLVCTDGDAGVVTSSWRAGEDGVTVRRCRSDDTLSSVTIRRAEDPQAVDRPSRHQIQPQQPPSCRREERILVEINRQHGSDRAGYGDLSVSREVDNSSQHQRRPRAERQFFIIV